MAKLRKSNSSSKRPAIVAAGLFGALGVTAALLWTLAPAPLSQADALTGSELTTLGTADDLAPVFEGVDLKPGQWTTIQVRQSGRTSGDLAMLADEAAAKGQIGALDHFAIGNGRGSADGALLIGPRWDQQLPSGHAQAGTGVISICLIGDLSQGPPTPRQVLRLQQLLASLHERTQARQILADSAVRTHLSAE